MKLCRSIPLHFFYNQSLNAGVIHHYITTVHSITTFCEPVCDLCSVRVKSASNLVYQRNSSLGMCIIIMTRLLYSSLETKIPLHALCVS